MYTIINIFVKFGVCNKELLILVFLVVSVEYIVYTVEYIYILIDHFKITQFFYRGRLNRYTKIF